MSRAIEILNAKPLQRKWAEENECEFNPENCQYTVPIEQIKRFSPDVLWIGSST